MIENGDVFIAISYSGASEELVQIVPQIKRRGAKLIAITGKADSALAREADVHLDAAVAQEAARTTWRPPRAPRRRSRSATRSQWRCSTSAASLGRGLRAHAPRRGARQALARQALLHVEDVMRTRAGAQGFRRHAAQAGGRRDVARRHRNDRGARSAGLAKGVFTDGDLRRTIERAPSSTPSRGRRQ